MRRRYKLYASTGNNSFRTEKSETQICTGIASNIFYSGARKKNLCVCRVQLTYMRPEIVCGFFVFSSKNYLVQHFPVLQKNSAPQNKFSFSPSYFLFQCGVSFSTKGLMWTQVPLLRYSTKKILT